METKTSSLNYRLVHKYSHIGAREIQQLNSCQYWGFVVRGCGMAIVYTLLWALAINVIGSPLMLAGFTLVYGKLNIPFDDLGFGVQMGIPVWGMIFGGVLWYLGYKIVQILRPYMPWVVEQTNTIKNSVPSVAIQRFQEWRARICTKMVILDE